LMIVLLSYKFAEKRSHTVSGVVKDR
jgi:hypothetical protein